MDYGTIAAYWVISGPALKELVVEGRDGLNKRQKTGHPFYDHRKNETLHYEQPGINLASS